jgi:tetratricopeptide (TPR) repeat protein
MATPLQKDAPEKTCQIWLFVLLVIVATVIAYLPVWHAKPIWDDNAHITASYLRSGQGLAAIWTKLGATQQYYPLVHTVFWIEQKLWGDSLFGYHLFNILIHALSAVVLFSILRRLAIPGAWLAAGLFALHPVQVESVAWISELKNTLSGLFFFLSILSYLNFDETRSLRAYFAALFLFLFGLMCKTAIAPMPAVLLVILWWRRGSLRPRDDILPSLPFFGLSIIAGSFTALVERIFVGAKGAAFQLTILQRCLIAARDFWFYLFKLAWPAKLTFIYPRWQVNAADWRQYLFLFGFLALLAFVWTLRKRVRGPLAAMLIFVGLLLPALGFINVYPFLYSFVADHFQYLACAAPLTLVATGVRTAIDWFAPAKHLVRRTTYAVLVITLGLLSWRQSRDYRDIETLWRTTIARNPDCWMAYSNLGSLFTDRGNISEAIVLFRKALDLWPNQSKDHNNLGKALLQQGRIGDAMEEFQMALRISPNDSDTENNIGAAYLQTGDLDQAVNHLRNAVLARRTNADAYINLGNALLRKREFDTAIEAYSATLGLPFDHAESHYSIANVFRQKGQLDDAVLNYKLAVQLRPDYPEAHNNLGNTFRQQGRIEEAIREYETALETALIGAPGSALVQNNLAWLLATAADARLRDGKKAVQLAEQAVVATDGSDPLLLHTLAAAYAENHEFDKAVAAAQDALKRAEANSITSLVESLRSEIALYQSGSPYHEAPPSR